jgi:hypothetical protein
VFDRHTQGVPLEQNPQPSLERRSRWEVGDNVVMKEVVKSISIGNESGDGTSGGDRRLERFRFVP